jgi:hypothetical protein
MRERSTTRPAVALTWIPAPGFALTSSPVSVARGELSIQTPCALPPRTVSPSSPMSETPISLIAFAAPPASITTPGSAATKRMGAVAVPLFRGRKVPR